MKKWISILLICILMLSFAAQVFADADVKTAEAYAENTEALNKPDYLGFLEDYYNTLSELITETDLYYNVWWDMRRVTYFAAYSAKLYEITGKQKYFDNLRSAFYATAIEVKHNSTLIVTAKNSFFIVEPLVLAYETLSKYEPIEPEIKRIILSVIRAVCSNHQIGDDNQSVSRANGALQAARVFPDDIHAKSWRQYGEECFEYWYSRMESDENAANYNSIAHAAMIKQAELLGRTEDLKKPEVKSMMFDRFNVQIPPFGLMPEYGDDYYGGGSLFIYVQEYAARLFDDPSYLVAAWKQFAAIKNNSYYNGAVSSETGHQDLNIIMEGYYMSKLLSLEPYDKDATSDKVGSCVTYRRDRAGLTTYNKLILAADKSFGAPAVFCDLYANGAHGHFSRTGSIGYYEAGGLPQFYGTARYNRSAMDSNMFAVINPEYDYPSPNKNQLEENVWRTESFPLRMLAVWDKDNPDLRNIEDVQIRIASGSFTKNFDFLIDNLRLIGKNGIKTVDSFEDVGSWVRNDNPYSKTDEHTEGAHGMCITVKPGSSMFYRSPSYHLTVDLQEYDTIAFDWKYQNGGEIIPKDQILFRLFDPIVIDTLLEKENYHAAYRNVTATDIGKDSIGDIDMTSYASCDNDLRRRIVLTEEGVLIIQDNFVSGELTSGYNIGPIWHMMTEPKATGKNWFNAESDKNKIFRAYTDGSLCPKNDLMVWFDTNEDAEYGSSEGIQIINNPTVTHIAYTKVKSEANKKYTFITVLYPHRNENPEEVAAAITSKTTGFMNSDVSYMSNGIKVSVKFDSDNVTVEREKE